jgi:naphthalene 1,2-dioxygenase system ferredoxin subunit
MSTPISESEWIDVMPTDDLPRNDVKGISVGEREIAIYTAGEAVYATDSVCTHGQAQLRDGYLDGYEIECPLHQGRFDVRDGKPLCAPVTEELRCYPVKVEGGRVYLRVD